MRRTSILSIAVALLLGVAFWVSAPPTLGQSIDAGVIKGSLVNRTPGGAGVGNASITLVTYKGTAEQGRASAKSDDQGRFQFAGLTTASDASYAISVLYQEAEYMTDFRRFDQGSSEIGWEIAVYDATPAADKIRIGKGHVIIDVREGSLWVLQFFSFLNTGEKTFVGSHPITDDGRKETLRVSLPSGAGDITAQEGLDECCAFRTDEGISDTLAVPPGGRNIVISYELPYKSSDVYLDLPVYYPVDSLNLLVSQDKAKVTSKVLKLQDPVDMGGKKYTHFSGTNLAADAEVSVDLTEIGGPATVTSAFRPDNLRWGALGAAALAIGFVMFYALRGRGTAVAIPAPAQAVVSREVLLRELAELDERFASGQLDEDKYERLQQDKNRRLRDLGDSEGDSDKADD